MITTRKVRRPTSGGRRHGHLDTISDSERRPLRPIGMTVREAAVRTSALLTHLLAIPGVRLVRGVRSGSAGLPRVPLALNAGRQVLLIEMVAWPPGRYETTADGRVHCDGTYIGQSCGSLRAIAGHWRNALPDDHRVSAIVVVHPLTAGPVTLPRLDPEGPAWLPAVDAAGRIRPRLLLGRRTASPVAVRALLAATRRNTLCKNDINTVR
jgi:hypothetical protein